MSNQNTKLKLPAKRSFVDLCDFEDELPATRRRVEPKVRKVAEKKPKTTDISSELKKTR